MSRPKVPRMIDHVRGATLRHRLRWPASLQAAEVTSEVLLPDGARQSLSLRVLEASDLLPGAAEPGFAFVEISAPAALTAAWPVAVLPTDVRCQIGDEVAHSEILYLNILPGVTRDAV